MSKQNLIPLAHEQAESDSPPRRQQNPRFLRQAPRRVRKRSPLVNRMTRPPAAAQAPEIAAGTILLLASACGLIVANIYYAQPLVGPIAQSLGLAPGAAGLVVTMTQIGYGLGLLFVVPLAD